jgi:uncharacterized protein (DUF1778 family)
MAAKKPGKVRRRKPDEDRKEESIRIRVTADQKSTLMAAAKRAGLGLSGWMLFVALREADADQR